MHRLELERCLKLIERHEIVKLVIFRLLSAVLPTVEMVIRKRLIEKVCRMSTMFLKCRSVSALYVSECKRTAGKTLCFFDTHRENLFIPQNQKTIKEVTLNTRKKVCFTKNLKRKQNLRKFFSILFIHQYVA